MRALNSYTRLRTLIMSSFVGLVFIASVPACAQTPQKVSHIIETRADELAQNNDLSGVLLLAKGDNVVFEKAYGYANRDFDIPNTLDTKFGLASMSKMFTALAIIRLFDEKELSLDSKLIEILPSYPNKEIAQKITIHQLLTHTSGLGFYWEGLDTNPRSKFDKLEDYVPLFVNDELSIEPGSHFAYSNAGYIVLGLIIEHLSGQDYHEYIDRTIFTPLGMHDTSSPRNDAVTKNRAIGYTRSLETPGEWINNLYQSEFRGSSAGGGISTARDLLKYANALKNLELLNEEQTARYIRPRVKHHRGHYGYGIETSETNGHSFMGHSGGHIGIASELRIFTDLDYTFIVLTNGEFDNFHYIFTTLMETLTGPTEKTQAFHHTESFIERIKDKGKADAMAYLTSTPSTPPVQSGQLTRAGLRYLHKGHPKTAIEIFEINAELFPDSNTADYYLADAYRVTGKPQKAIAAYKAYLKTFPGDADALRWIDALEK